MINYKEQYLLHCENLNSGTTKEDIKKHNNAMRQLAKLYHKIEKENNKTFLLELLQNSNERTQALVAAHCLGLGIYIPESKKVLTIIAKNKRNQPLAFEAQSTLNVWKQQGYLKF